MKILYKTVRKADKKERHIDCHATLSLSEYKEETLNSHL